jgi:hypothetical protein
LIYDIGDFPNIRELGFVALLELVGVYLPFSFSRYVYRGMLDCPWERCGSSGVLLYGTVISGRRDAREDLKRTVCGFWEISGENKDIRGVSGEEWRIFLNGVNRDLGLDRSMYLVYLGVTI